MTAKAASLVPLLLMLCAAGAPARPLEQLLPLPPIAAPPTPAPSPPPVNPGAPAAPPQGISPFLLQPGGPVFTQPRSLSQPSPPPAASAPIDQQKTTSYQRWLSGQLRLLERSGESPADPLYRELQQQLLQLDQSGAPR